MLATVAGTLDLDAKQPKYNHTRSSCSMQNHSKLVIHTTCMVYFIELFIILKKELNIQLSTFSSSNN